MIMGERYKMVTKETKDVLSGKYGQQPENRSIRKYRRSASGCRAITCRPQTFWQRAAEAGSEMEQYKQQDEDVLSYALFPQVAMDFFKYRQAQKTKVDETVADTKNGAYPV